MKILFKKILLAAFVMILVVSCEQVLLQQPYSNTPTGNFKAFTDDFARLYGAFGPKNIDWDSITLHYSQQVNNDMSDAALFAVFCEMLNLINDGHADIYSSVFGHYRSWNRRSTPFFEGRTGNRNSDIAHLQHLIRQQYLGGEFESKDVGGWLFFYGSINHKGKKLGYLCVPTFYLNDFPREFIKKAVQEFNEMDGLVIDLRFNGGGNTDAFVWMMNLMASREKVYMQSAFRNGEAYDDFTQMVAHRVRPHADGLKEMPVVILTNAYTASSSDHFVLGMKTQQQVTIVGDTTCGAFSAVLERILPNGWKFRLGAQVVFNADGEYLSDASGLYLEGIGIAPDHHVIDSWSLVQQGKDPSLDKALTVLAP